MDDLLIACRERKGESRAIRRSFSTSFPSGNSPRARATLFEILLARARSLRRGTRIAKIFVLNLQSIEKQIEQWQQRYDRERETHERQIRQVRNEIEDDRRYLEELTTEVTIREARDGTGNIFISFPRVVRTFAMQSSN